MNTLDTRIFHFCVIILNCQYYLQLNNFSFFHNPRPNFEMVRIGNFNGTCDE